MQSINQVNMHQHISEVADSASITSFAQQVSGTVAMDPLDTQTQLQSVTEEKTVDLIEQAAQVA